MKIDLTDAEKGALLWVMEARYENVLDVRDETGDNEFDQTDEDQCNTLIFMLSDFDYDADTVASVGHLFDAIENALDTPTAFEDLDFDALRSGARKIGYYEAEAGA
jgi:hypothetical protein